MICLNVTPSGDLHVLLWISLCGWNVDSIIVFRDTANCISRDPLSFVRLWKLWLPFVEKLTTFLPTWALKSPRTIFMSFLGLMS